MRDIKIKQRRGYLEIAPKVVSEYASYKDLSKPSLFSDNQVGIYIYIYIYMRDRRREYFLAT